jgi:hypothetical protein
MFGIPVRERRIVTAAPRKAEGKRLTVVARTGRSPGSRRRVFGQLVAAELRGGKALGRSVRHEPYCRIAQWGQ